MPAPQKGRPLPGGGHLARLNSSEGGHLARLVFSEGGHPARLDSWGTMPLGRLFRRETGVPERALTLSPHRGLDCLPGRLSPRIREQGLRLGLPTYAWPHRQCPTRPPAKSWADRRVQHFVSVLRCRRSGPVQSPPECGGPARESDRGRSRGLSLAGGDGSQAGRACHPGRCSNTATRIASAG